MHTNGAPPAQGEAVNEPLPVGAEAPEFALPDASGSRCGRAAPLPRLQGWLNRHDLRDACSARAGVARCRGAPAAYVLDERDAMREEVIGVARKLIDSARSLRDRFRWPGGRPPKMGGAVPAW